MRHIDVRGAFGDYTDKRARSEYAHVHPREESSLRHLGILAGLHVEAKQEGGNESVVEAQSVARSAAST